METNNGYGIAKNYKIEKDNSLEKYNEYLVSQGESPIIQEQFDEIFGSPKLRTAFAGSIFVPTSSPLSGIVNKDNVIKVVAATMKDGLNGAASAASTILQEQGINFLRGSINFPSAQGSKQPKTGTTSSTVPPEGAANVPPPGGSPMETANSLLGSYEVNPLKIELKPGIKNRIYSNTYNAPTQYETYCHITQARVDFVSMDDSLQFFIDNILIPELSARAQLNVNFNVDTTLLVNYLNQYLNNLTYALNLYYFNTSIISYCNIPGNPDMGMKSLRSMISTVDIDYLQQLKQLLLNLPIPPNLNSLIFFLNQNFTDGDNGQTILKLMPTGFNASTSDAFIVSGFNGGSDAASNKISLVIKSLSEVNLIKLASILTRICPNWINSRVYDASPTLLYSKTFLTIFSNAPYIVSNSAGTDFWYGPTVTNESTIVDYNCFDNMLDGVAIALHSDYISGINTRTYPAFLSPMYSTITTGGYTRKYNRFTFSYSTSLADAFWRPSSKYIESAFSRPDRFKIYNDTYYNTRIANAFIVQGLNIKIMREAAKDLLHWVMSFESFISQKFKSNSNNKPSNNKKKRGDPRRKETPKTDTTEKK